MKKEGTLTIPLETFLFNNDYGLLYSSYEIPTWMIFLFSIAEMLQIEEYKTRGSAIALAVISILAETEEEKAEKAKQPFYPHKGYKAVEGFTNVFESIDDSSIRIALTPYTVLSEILRTDQGIESLTKAEKQVVTFFIQGINKKNVDIYIDIDSVEDIPETTEKILNLFINNPDIKIEKMRYAIFFM